MKRNIRFGCFLAIVVALLTISGCATNKVSTYAFASPEKAVSISHPVEMEKNGDQYVTVFSAILDAGVWGVESVKGAGVWPALAGQKGLKPSVGYVFVTDLNWWGDFLLQGVIVGRKADFVKSKIVYLNRDGGWVYDLMGQEYNYDPEKFDKEIAYQAGVFQNGTTLAELQTFWQMYAEKRGVDFETAGIKISREIKIGSPEWEEFKMQLASRLDNYYKMPNGEIRQGFLSLKDFRRESAKNNGATAGQRFARSAFIPVAIDPISAGIGVASSVLNGLVAANNGSLQGFYARAEGLRGDLKGNFELMQVMYKQLLMQRDAVIYELQQNQALSAPRRLP